MFFIHNKYDKHSSEMLETLPEGTVVIDFFGLRQAGDMTYGDMNKLEVCALPCMMEELKFIEEKILPDGDRQLTEAEKNSAKLDYLLMMQE